MCYSQQKYVEWRRKGKAVCASICNKPVKLATSVSRPPVTGGRTFTEAANSYNIMHGHYSLHKLASHLCTSKLRYSSTLSAPLYVQVQPPFAGRTEV